MTKTKGKFITFFTGWFAVAFIAVCISGLLLVVAGIVVLLIRNTP